MSRWKPINTAPKDVLWSDDIAGYGPKILAYPTNGGGVGVVRWWQSKRNKDYRGWEGACGNTFSPTHWMPLPPAPQAGA